jgi:hypothetical protein
MTRNTNNREQLRRRNAWRNLDPWGITSRVLNRLVLVALLVTAGAACKHNKSATTTVTRRAAFDLACPKEELKLNVVDTEGVRKMASQIAVRGCEQKAVYVYYPDSDTWIIDGIVTPLSSDYQVPPPIGKGRGKRGDKQTQKAEKRGKMESGSPAPVEAAPVEPAAPDAPLPDPS